MNAVIFETVRRSIKRDRHRRRCKIEWETAEQSALLLTSRSLLHHREDTVKERTL